MYSGHLHLKCQFKYQKPLHSQILIWAIKTAICPFPVVAVVVVVRGNMQKETLNLTIFETWLIFDKFESRHFILKNGLFSTKIIFFKLLAFLLTLLKIIKISKKYSELHIYCGTVFVKLALFDKLQKID
jgi:hypothetical protein